MLWFYEARKSRAKDVLPPGYAISIAGCPNFLLCERALGLLFSTPGMRGVRGSIVCKTIGTVVDFRQVGREKLEETEPGGLVEYDF